MDCDTFLEAEEAKEFGIVDHVYDRRPGLPGDDAPKDGAKARRPDAFWRSISRHPGLDPGSIGTTDGMDAGSNPA